MVSQCPRGSSQILYPTEAKNWAYLLNERERKVVSVIKEKYKKRFGRPAVNDKNLLAHLGDNPQTHLNWSAVSGRVPALRMNSGKMYSPHLQRWMCAREKLAMMGFPVEARTAMSMGVPALPVTDPQRAALLAGNCMHFGCVLLAEFLGLTCFSPKGHFSGRFGRFRLLPDTDSDSG